VALLAWQVFVCVAQGTESLRTVGEGMANNQSYGPRAFAFFVALIGSGRRDKAFKVYLSGLRSEELFLQAGATI
jgi:hypothetical protein